MQKKASQSNFQHGSGRKDGCFESKGCQYKKYSALSFGEDHKKAIEKNPYRQIESSVFFRDTGFQQFENDRWYQLQKIFLRNK